MARSLPAIPVLDVREGGPVAHASLSRERMLALRDACFSILPPWSRGIAGPLDAVSRRWLAASPSPYVREIAAVAALAGRPGVWFVNASYEWACTTRIDVEPVPRLRRTLDWPFPGLGRHVEVALQDGGKGAYANVTWPGSVGVLTAVAPGRFAAAINQAPMLRGGPHGARLPFDLLRNGAGTWRRGTTWPPAHLLRYAFDTCATYREAVALLSQAPLAKPVLFSIVGSEAGEGCLIERMPDDARVYEGAGTIANLWRPDGPARPGYWHDRGTLLGATCPSEPRSAALAACIDETVMAWVAHPVLNGATRLAVEASAATGALAVRGFEPDGSGLAVPATATLRARVECGAIIPVDDDRAAA